jgi:hypothetical protein
MIDVSLCIAIAKKASLLTTRGLPVAEHILTGCWDLTLFATLFTTFFTWPRMDKEPAKDLPEANVEEARALILT